jgi:hypothetical protein
MSRTAKSPCEVCAEYKATNVTGLRNMVFTKSDEPPWLRSPKAVLKNMERESRSVRTSHANRLG